MTARSESVEMYLKSLAELGGETTAVPVGRIAERLGVSVVSTNEMMKRLAQQDLVNHLPYKGVILTAAGKSLANNVIRRQRLWECFLVDHLQIDWAEAFDLACDLEHATSTVVADTLAEYLGQPEFCPHGNPIPDTQGNISTPVVLPLTELAIGDSAIIRAITPENSEVLAYLAERRIFPGTSIKLIEAAPLDGPLTIEIDDVNGRISFALGINLAALVLVEKRGD